jgi:hypothetical protein
MAKMTPASGSNYVKAKFVPWPRTLAWFGGFGAAAVLWSVGRSGDPGVAWMFHISWLPLWALAAALLHWHRQAERAAEQTSSTRA